MRAVRRRCGRLGVLVLWGLVILLVGAFVGTGETAGQELHHAGLVVTFPDGQTERRCVEFTEEEISGAELLRRSGLAVVFSDFGGLGTGVCRIGDTGCSDPGDCFCQCRGADCAYWSYFTLQDGEWRFQNVGASQRRVRDGDVDGWVWGSGRTPPEQVTFGELCPLAVATLPPPPPSPTEAAAPPGGSPNAGSGVGTATPADSGSPVTPLGRPESTAPPAPSEGSGEPTSPASMAAATPPATGEVRQAAGPGEIPEDAGPTTDAEQAATAVDEPGGGPPAGLIAFGGVAGLLAAAIAGLALRRRLGG